MAIDNILRKYKETPEGLRGLLELGGLMLLIISIFIIFYIIFPGKEKVLEEDLVQESNQSEENYEEVINSLPSGQVNFYSSDEGYELTLTEYEAVCKNSKIVTQRSIMGAHITDISAQKLYKDNGITGEGNTVTYCRIGERSSHTWFVLTQLLGYSNVSNYDGSWTEWGSIVGAPIEK